MSVEVAIINKVLIMEEDVSAVKFENKFDLLIDLDDADRTKVYEDHNELFQREGFDAVSRIFEEKKRYLEYVVKDRGGARISDCRVHDTIFIAGDRGVGKTAFMLNIKKYIERQDCGGLGKTYIFLKPVDPTLLEDHEHFLSIVVAQIVEEVDNSCQGKGNDDSLESYYKALRDLSESLKAVKERKEDKGIEEIVSSQNSLKLEQHAHNFFKTAAQILGGKAVVILIDDVDMALEKGIHVLEVVRKYLASPYAIPIVSGDLTLYEEVLLAHFEQPMTNGRPEWLMKDNNRSDTKKFVSEGVKDLVDQYLAKIFPAENRVHLQSIYQILVNNRVKLRTHSKEVPYNIFKDIEIRLMNLGVNQVNSTQEVLWDNARLFMQYLAKKKEFIAIVAEAFPYDKYAVYARHTRYMEAKRELLDEYDRFIFETYLSGGMNYLKKSYVMTAQIYQYFRKRSQLSWTCYNDANAISVDGVYHQKRAFYSDYLNSDKNLEYQPVRESIFDDLFVSKKANERKFKSIVNTRAGLIFNLFCFDDYYSSYQTKLYLVAGKFFDLLITSLDPNFNGNDVERIVYSTPFNINAPSHRYIQESAASIEGDVTDQNIPISGDVYDNLANEIKKWQEEHVGAALLQFIPTYLLLKVSNKFFNNVNIVKGARYDAGKTAGGKDSGKDVIFYNANREIVNEPLLTFLQRMVMIFLNAIGSFESRTVVANTNIGIGRNFSAANWKSDNAYRRNIEPLLADKRSLVSFYSKHPIIIDILKNMSNREIDFSEIIIGKGKKDKDSRTLAERLDFETEALYKKREYGKVIETTINVLSQYAISECKDMLSELKNRGRRYQKSIEKTTQDSIAYSKYEEVINRFAELLKEIEDASE